MGVSFIEMIQLFHWYIIFQQELLLWQPDIYMQTARHHQIVREFNCNLKLEHGEMWK